MEPMSPQPVNFGSGPMLTKKMASPRIALLVAGVLVSGTIAMLVLTGPAGAIARPIDAAPYRLPADDRTVLSDVTFGDPPTIALDAETAEDLATAQYDPVALGATSVDFYLERITVPGTALSPDPIRDRGAWIMRLGGMTQEQPGPVTADGVTAPGHVLQSAYVFIDAETGEFLFAEWHE